MSDPNQPYGAVPQPSYPPPSPPPGGPYGSPYGGPPSGPPGYPPPPGGSGGKGNGLLIALGIVGVLALAGVVVALVLLLTGDDGEGGGDDGGGDAAAEPAAVVERLVAAAGDADCDTALTLLTEEARAADPCSQPDFQLLSAEDVDSEVGEAAVDGDAATVPVTFTSGEGSTDYVFALEQVDEEWLVASYDVDHGGHDDPTDGATDGDTDSATDGGTDGPAPGGTSTADAVANEPTAVVEAFFDSVFDGDCATAEDLVTEAYLEEEGRCEPGDLPSSAGLQIEYEVGAADVTGTTAEVPVEISFAGQKETSTVELVQVDGLWRISSAD
ncbi:MAG TPA: hypothetical protein VNT31_15715 [Nocardioides sp.]|nr:hypothetical protein [Nocardioides sp.]